MSSAFIASLKFLGCLSGLILGLVLSTIGVEVLHGRRTLESVLPYRYLSQRYIVVELLALNCTGVYVLLAELAHHFQDNSIPHCVIMDLLIITNM